MALSRALALACGGEESIALALGGDRGREMLLGEEGGERMEEGEVRVNAKRWKYKRGLSDCYEGVYEGMKKPTWIDERMMMTWGTGEDSNDGKVPKTFVWKDAVNRLDGDVS